MFQLRDCATSFHKPGGCWPECCPLRFNLHTVYERYLVQVGSSFLFPYSNNKKNYHFDLTGAFSNIIEESEAIEYDDDDDEDEFDDDDDD